MQRKQKSGTSDRCVKMQHHTQKLKDIPANWEWTGRLLWGKEKKLVALNAKREIKG